MSGYHAWLDAFKIHSDGSSATCPECKEGTINVVVVRHPDSDVGWAIMYCPACRKGARISRMGVTDTDDYVTEERMLELVPADIELIY
ncbi:MAG: hypothetical protein KC766_40600 [Myxococcales bacterium]|nr:hypothetical protein [Myxococcales bacterium]